MILALLAAPAHAGSTPVEDPVELERRSRRVEDIALSTLGVWSLANLAGGTAGYFLSDRPELKSFHLTNAAWNTVNAGLAIGGLIGGRNRDTSSLEGVQKRRGRLQDTLRINLLLDGVYVAAGTGIALAGRELDRPMIMGIGASVLVQGTFLTIFDTLFLHAHVSAGSMKVQVVTTGNGVHLAGTW